jgi:CubicO group peptidase (beta-lactamase class C family)
MKKNLTIILLTIALCANVTISFSQKNTSDGLKPISLNDGIKIATCSKVGMDTAVINEITTQITSGFYPNIHSLLIYKNNRLVYEKYFPGKDQSGGNDLGIIEHNLDDLHGVRSISKSITGACIGIAINQGKIKSADQKVMDFFNDYPAYDTGMKKELTIQHLLTMTSGLDWNEDIPYDNPENSEIQMTQSADPINFILSRPIVSLPGGEWKYNGGTTQLLAAIMERATGQKVDEFAKEYLFKPLGITKFDWIKFPRTNNPRAASGLRLRSRDLLKFGILYQNKGKWEGKQIINREWIEQSFQTMVKRTGSTGGYGYQFWTFSDTLQKQPVKIIAAVGNGDQRIYFDEKNRLLVVTTAGNYNLWTIKNNSYAIMKRIYTAFHVK